MSDATDNTATEDVVERIDKLEEVVRKLAATVNRIAQHQPTSEAASDPKAEPPARWATRDELVEWVAWLVDRYDLSPIVPDCWARHGALVEEFDALRMGWLASVLKGAGMAPLQWHDHLARVLDRIEHGRWRTCNTGEHDPPTLPEWSGDQDSIPIDLATDRYKPPAPGLSGS